jgi:hypothetical protein
MQHGKQINLIQLGDCMKLVVKKQAVHEGVRNRLLYAV